MSEMSIEKKVFEFFDTLVPEDLDPEGYSELCAVIGEAFMVRAEND